MKRATLLWSCLAVLLGLVARGFAADAALDPQLVGAWYMTFNSPQGAGVWKLEIKTNGVYATTQEGTSGAPMESGLFQGADGKWSVKAASGRTDSGTYLFPDEQTLLLRSETATTVWKNIAPKLVPVPVRVPLRPPATNSIATTPVPTPKAPAPLAPPKTNAVKRPSSPSPMLKALAESDRLNQQGFALLEKNFKQATNLITRAIAANPLNADALGNLGLAKFRSALRHGGEPGAGLPELYSCYQIDFHLRDKFERAFVQEEIRYSKNSHSNTNHPAVPPDKMSEIARLNDPTVACETGEKILAGQNNPAAALAQAYFLRALELDPLNARARADRGHAFYFGYTVPDVPWAIYNLNAATRLDPNAFAPKRDRGMIQLQLFAPESALVDFSVALQLEPSSLELRTLHAITALLIGRTNDAELDKAACRKIAPDEAPKIEAYIDHQAARLANAPQTAAPPEQLLRDIEQTRQWEKFVRANAAARAQSNHDSRSAQSIIAGSYIPSPYQ